MPGQDHAHLHADAEDRRAALAAATTLIAADGGMPHGHRSEWLEFATEAYRWLGGRDSLRAATIQLIAGKPYPEGSSPMTATINLDDTNELPFTLGGADAKGAEVGAPSDTWSWTLTDPDQSGAVLTVSGDTTSATVAAGTPTPNLSLSVVGANTQLQGAEAIIVQATAATTISLVAGTPTAEAPAAPAAPEAPSAS